MSCKSALSMLIFLDKPLALIQGPFKSWWQCLQPQLRLCTFMLLFLSYSSKRQIWKSLVCAWWELIMAGHKLLCSDPFLLLGLQHWWWHSTSFFIFFSFGFFFFFLSASTFAILLKEGSEALCLSMPVLERHQKSFDWSTYSDAWIRSFLIFSLPTPAPILSPPEICIPGIHQSSETASFSQVATKGSTSMA